VNELKNVSKIPRNFRF